MAIYGGRQINGVDVARAGLLRPPAVADLVPRFRAGESALANRALSLIALHVWWEDYLGAARIY